MDSDRLIRLNQFLNDIFRGKRELQTSSNAKIFFEAVCQQEDATGCVERLVASKAAMSNLQSAFRLDLSKDFIDQNIAPFILFLAKPGIRRISAGQYLEKILQLIIEPPTLWKAFLKLYDDGLLEDKSLHAFAWLLSEILSLPHSEELGAWRDAQTIVEDGALIRSSSHDIRVLHYRMENKLRIKGCGLPIDSTLQLGGRHDNDFADFRKISIFPTADELLSTDRPFYRQASDIEEADPEHRVAIHLDNQFRLLREDMLAELREDLQVALGQKGGRRRSPVLSDLALVSIPCGDENRLKPCALACHCGYGLEQLTDLPMENRKSFLGNNRNFLKHQSFGCLLDNGLVVAFATLDRDENALLSQVPAINLQIRGDNAFEKTLLAFKQKKDLEFRFVETPFFAYEPVLKRLQELAEIPIMEELLASTSPLHPPSPSLFPGLVVDQLRQSYQNDVQDCLGTSEPIHLDSSQMASLTASLAQSLSLIQGPPGTGKSFIGALLAKAFHRFTESIILVICYTNHALDQFLEEFLDIGIPPNDIVRLGSKSTPRTMELNLSEQNDSFKPSKDAFTMMRNLKDEAKELRESLQHAFEHFTKSHIQPKDVLASLEFSEKDCHFFDALQIPEAIDGMIKVGKNGKPVRPDYIFDRWCSGQDAGIFKDEVLPENQSIWDMPSLKRKSLFDEWVEKLVQEKISNIVALKQRLDDCQRQVDDLLGQRTLAILNQKRVIGCTTTAAAKYARHLQNCCPSVVLVEEAGEILESHILTALSPSTQQLVLIGDHKQLRPKVNNYALTVEKGDGYDLNRSLFERCVLAGLPHTVLTKQHRMAPEISALVRHLTYPDLLDAPTTLERPAPRGLQDRVVFFDHNHFESSVEQIADLRDEGAKSSKRNEFEAHMVLKVVRYLAQQGYGTDKLVVLTPYLGQLHLLRDKLSKDSDPVLNDLDSFDLIQAGLLSQAGAKVKQRPIRLSTIDNYQGEESDIVIASLTRSNENRDIGFMVAPERLNVLLSRARQALIIIGNANTFKENRRGQKTWLPLFNYLAEHHHLYDGLPIQCERHPSKRTILREIEAFDLECPDGGCDQPCGAKLNCGIHDCPQRCHQLYDHSKMDCRHVIEVTCARDHKYSRPCFKKTAPCEICESEDLQKENKRKRDLALEKKRLFNQKLYECKLQEIQDEIEHEQRLQRDMLDDKEREKVLEQRRRDLRSIKEVGLKMKDASLQDTSTEERPQDEMATSSDQGRTKHGTQQQNASDPNALDQRAEDEWNYQKKYENTKNEAIDSLMAMIGLEDVKQKFLSIKSKVDTAIRQHVNLKDERFGVTLLGNPGTGKTTVARLYAKFLASVGVLPESSFIECSGAGLASGGVADCKEKIEDLLKQGGGAFFIDEAYQLVSNSRSGTQVLDFLLTEVENLTGKIVFILAGYNKQMESFFSHNPGIPSRFPHELQFKDYEDAELLEILAGKIDKKYTGRMSVEDGLKGLYARIIARRIGRGRGKEGHGNARAVENYVSLVTERQAKRFRKERKAGRQTNDMHLTKEDLIGPEPSVALANSNAWVKLNKLVGLETVKESVKSLVDTIQYNYDRELEEAPLVEFTLNRVFLGSPGTGKTSVAKLYGEILAHIGMLSNGEVVVKNPSDFVGSVIGESESKTKGILASTVGKVLVIDEAYGLCNGSGGDGVRYSSDPYRTAIIDTLVAEVQSTPGDDRCVLLLGYKDQMENMFQQVNPGLSRRFPLDSGFEFADFTDEEMAIIMDLKLKEQGFSVTIRGRKVALDVLKRARNRVHFGNAGEIDILLNSAKANHQQRLSKGVVGKNKATLEASDFDKDFDRGERSETNVRKLFEDSVGNVEVITRLEGYQKTVRVCKSLDMDPRDQIPFNFLFRGPPGTGKTTTARKMGKVYYDMGFLASAEVIESSATDLVGQYVGHTGPKTQKLLEKALGKVLLIDEAYRLAEGRFAQEAMEEIVDCITKPKYASKLIIIFAGYDEEINHLMAVNPGLTSRFPESLTFAALSPADCLGLLQSLLQGKQQKLAQKGAYLDMSALSAPEIGVKRNFEDHFAILAGLPNWANARDIHTLSKKIFNEVLKAAENMPATFVASATIVMEAINDMIKERRQRAAMSKPPPHVKSKCASSQTISSPLDHRSTTATTGSSKASPPKSDSVSQQRDASPQKPPDDIERNVPFQDAPDSTKRDAEVSDAIWEALQRDKAAAEELDQQYKDLKAQETTLEKSLADTPHEVETAARPTTDPSNTEQQEGRPDDDDNDDDEAKRQHEQARLHHELERRRLEADLETIRRKRHEAEQRRKAEAQAQEKLREMGVCCQGFRWIKQAGGYRCAGGSHWVSDAQL